MREKNLYSACSKRCGPARLLIIALVHGYQCCVRPLLIGTCKFHPTCSEYAVEALHAHGVVHGLRLTVGRVLRCHPFGPGGLDPVPPRPPGASEKQPGAPEKK